MAPQVDQDPPSPFVSVVVDRPIHRAPAAATTEHAHDASAVQAAALHEAISRGGPDPGEKDMLIAAVGQGQWLPENRLRSSGSWPIN